MQYKTIIHEKKDQVCYITLNRPKVGNAINAQMSRELADVCRTINQDEEIMVVILKGAGGAFSSGSEPQEWEAGCDASRAIDSLERVTIAAIDGAALGEGLELALACDIRIASERASFCLPHTAYGLIPGGGGTQRLPRLVGKGKALEMILTAEPIDADEAYRIGLVSKVVSVEELLSEVNEWAKRIITCGPIALRYAKEAVNKGLDFTLEQGLRLEADLYFLIQTTEDRMEGIRAFREKRLPQFKGE
ncbi:MAG: enoyl-CoA hydratase/isomerase family protein [Dehalococcoidia bacterium]|nr:MAG: enoyl-CoA hydratase/isomerase family protein [Dehalococcoidia bacterium]